jgi:hypothetical protein
MIVMRGLILGLILRANVHADRRPIPYAKMFEADPSYTKTHSYNL